MRDGQYREHNILFKCNGLYFAGNAVMLMRGIAKFCGMSNAYALA